MEELDFIKNEKMELNNDIKQTSEASEVVLDEQSKSKSIIIKKDSIKKNI